MLAFEEVAYLLSAKTRRHWLRQQRLAYPSPLPITNDHVRALLKGEVDTPGPMEKADWLLLYLSEKEQVFGDAAEVDGDTDYPVCTARNGSECKALAAYLRDAGFLADELHGNLSNLRFQATLTMDGWERVRDLQATQARPEKAFIAMSFSEDAGLKEMFERGFKPALKACGYEDADRLVLPAPDAKMCDAILAEVKRSGIVLADFTEQKPNVYYEAGFAQGLGTPVIKTCRKDELKAGKCAFDTRQYPHIEWEPGKHADFIKRIVDYVDLHGLRGPGADR
jgi:hypothetical protein